MTLEDGTELVPGAGHRRVRRQDAGARRPVHQGRPVRPARGRRPARLRRDGRPRCRDQHRRRRPRPDRRGDRLRRRRRGRGRRRRGSPARPRSSPSTSTTEKLEWATDLGATHTVNSTEQRRRRGDPGAHRRLRRRRRDRRGRPPRDLEAGVLRPRPRRHRRPGRRAHAGHEDPRPPADRRLRPRRRAEVELVRRLPALARLPDARRPLPAGPARPRRVRDRGDRPRRRRGGVREDARTATCCARSWSSDGRPHRPRGVLRARSRSTARPSTSTTTSGWSATTASAWSSTPRTTSTGSSRSWATARVKAILCTHAHDDHVRVAPALRERVTGADPAAPRRPAALGADPPRRAVGRRPRPTARRSRSPARRCGCCTRPGHAPGGGLLLRRRPRLRVHRRHPVPGRARRDRPLVQRPRRAGRLASATGCSHLPDETVVHTGHGDDTTIGGRASGQRRQLDMTASRTSRVSRRRRAGRCQQ